MRREGIYNNCCNCILCRLPSRDLHVLELQMPVHGTEHNIQRCVYILAVLKAKQMIKIIEHLRKGKRARHEVL